MKEKKLVEFVEKQITVEELLLTVKVIVAAYSGVSGAKRSLEIMKETTEPLAMLEDKYRKQIESLQKQEISDEEKREILKKILVEQVDVKLAKVTTGEIEYAEKLGLIKPHFNFYKTIKDILI